MLSRLFTGLLSAFAVASIIPGIIQAQDTPVAKNVVLVHGLYADGSSWIDVIPYLQRAGLNVTVVQNPLTSLADDVAATRRVLASQDGPTVLVGHSFAGTIISEAGDDPKVSALVYVAARAPDAGEDFGALAAKFPKPPASAGVIKREGFFWLSEKAFLKDFAGDVEPLRARALYAVQGRGADALPSTKTTTAAWRELLVIADKIIGEPPHFFMLAINIKIHFSEMPASPSLPTTAISAEAPFSIAYSSDQWKWLESNRG